MTAAAYIRRSHQDAGGQVSKEDQLEGLHALAERYGESISDTFSDWGRSGGDSDDESDALKHRPQFKRLLGHIEAGDYSAVFAQRIDRFGRSTHALGRLYAACQKTGTKLVTSEGDFTDPDDPSTFLVRHTFEGFAVYYLKEQTRKNRRALKFCKERGDDFGQPGYGRSKQTPRSDDTERVTMALTDPTALERLKDAYTEAGSYSGAALRLNEAGVPIPRTGWSKRARWERMDPTERSPQPPPPPLWSATTVRRIIKREAPEVMSEAVNRRARTTSPRLFRQLLRCHCGTRMTPAVSTRSFKSYMCGRCKQDPERIGPYSISEGKLKPWIVAEAAKLRPPAEVEVDAEHDADDSADKRRRLEAARDLMSDDAYREAMAKLDAEDTAAAERALVLVSIPRRVDWDSWSTADINTVLKAMFTVHLGADLLPERAAWNVPWRAA